MNIKMIKIEEIKTSVCPICGGANQCASAADLNAKSCWCVNKNFPEGIFELVPEKLIRKTCICKNCLKKYKEDKNIV